MKSVAPPRSAVQAIVPAIFCVFCLGVNHQSVFAQSSEPAKRPPTIIKVDEVFRLGFNPPRNYDQDSIQLKKLSGPDGVTVQGNAIQWKPTLKEVGLQHVKLAFVLKDNAEKEVASATLRFLVELPRVSIGFDVKGVDVSPDHQWLVLWGEHKSKTTQKITYPLALVDLKSKTVVVRSEFPSPISVAIDQDNLYLSQAEKLRIHRYNLKLKKTDEFFLHAGSQGLLMIGPQRLASNAKQIIVYDTKTMMPVEKDDRYYLHDGQCLWRNEKYRGLGQSVVDWTTGETIGISLSRALRLPLMSRQFKKLGGAYLSVAADGFGDQDYGSPIPFLYSSGEFGESSSPIAGPPALKADSTVACDFPAVCEFAYRFDGDYLIESWKLKDVDTGKAAFSSDLFWWNYVDTGARIRPVPASGQLGGLLIGETLVAWFMEELIFAEIPTDVLESLPTPPHFGLKQLFEVPLQGKQTIKLTSEGNWKNPYYTLLRQHRSLQIDSATGEITADVEKLWNELLDQRRGDALDYALINNGSARVSREEHVAIYRQITGKELPVDKMAAWFPLEVAVEDDNGKKDQFQGAIIVLGPREAYENRKERPSKLDAEAIPKGLVPIEEPKF
ncbi:hypothetical protein C5Y96_00960 [Blastopirellula marina]|uniref:Uncharacterized protein n=1 Tax=Blastopirellula marina TaxID=124 RepID=A0A2S8G9J8_9BACT|nr:MULTISPECIES: hypothetical protein [Pirellulaceae]PQO40774.1 hypothetical protein C5Y96_00960 [Blastopirellula marina]RCS56101.1 hypothetical protein DTL36_00960 [Bremerella cremea]